MFHCKLFFSFPPSFFPNYSVRVLSRNLSLSYDRTRSARSCRTCPSLKLHPSRKPPSTVRDWHPLSPYRKSLYQNTCHFRTRRISGTGETILHYISHTDQYGNSPTPSKTTNPLTDQDNHTSENSTFYLKKRFYLSECSSH